MAWGAVKKDRIYKNSWKTCNLQKKNSIFATKIDFSSYGIHLNDDKFKAELLGSTLATKIDNIRFTLSNLIFEGDKMLLKKEYDIEDYFVSFITAFIWKELLDNSKKFTIETVMSH